MKTKGYQRWGNALAVVFLAASMLITTGGQAAVAQEPSQVAEQAYLLPIPLPDLMTADLPDRLDRDMVDSVTKGLLAKEADRILEELRLLKDRGLVNDYEIMPDAPVVRVMLAQENAPEVAQSLPGEAILLVEEAGGVPACISNGAEVQPELVLAASRAQNRHDRAALAADLVLVAGPPVIEVYYYEWNGSSFGYVTGIAAPKSEVKFRLLRNGEQVALDYRVSHDDGGYYFASQYAACINDEWEPMPGDIVEVSAGGFTSSTVVTPIQGWVDGDVNTVSGFTSPGSTVRVELEQIDRSMPCSWQRFIKTGSADAAGNFNIDLGDMVDFDRSASAVVYSMDAAGNSTFYPARTYQLVVNQGLGYRIILRPLTSFSLVLKRGAVIIGTESGITDDWGNFNGEFFNAAEPGDQATLTFNGGQLSYTVLALPQVTIDRATGQVNGTAAPGTLLGASVSSWFSNRNIQRCSYADKCMSQTVPSNGQFIFTLGKLLSGERLLVDLYSTEGEIYFSLNNIEPVFVSSPASDDLLIDLWKTQNLQATLRDSANTVKDSYVFNADYSLDVFDIHFDADMVPGDRIEVTDGFTTRWVTVGNLTDLRVKYNTNQITGTASAGHLVVTTYEEFLYHAIDCVEKEHTGGAFNITAGRNFISRDSSMFYLRDSDGNYTEAFETPFVLNLTSNSRFIKGVTETDNTTVTWTLKSGTAVLGTGSETSLGNDFFLDLGVAPQPGDILEITTGDGNYVAVTYPEITLQVVAAELRIYGRAVANQSLGVGVMRETPDGYYYLPSYFHWADVDGNYSIHYPPQFWPIDCTPVSLDGNCLSYIVSSRLPEGFWIWKTYTPPPVLADGFELDDSWEFAKRYLGPQVHSLHNSNDEDWVKFTLRASDVANPILIPLRVENSGALMDLNLELYSASNLSIPLATAWGEYDPVAQTQPPSIDYTFTQAGTYYLRIHSKGSDRDGGYCSSVYTLSIPIDPYDPPSVFLPLITR